MNVNRTAAICIPIKLTQNYCGKFWGNIADHKLTVSPHASYNVSTYETYVQLPKVLKGGLIYFLCEFAYGFTIIHKFIIYYLISHGV